MVKFFKDGLQEMLGDKVDFLFCNEEEVFIWIGVDDIEVVVEELKQICSSYVIILGEYGFLVFDGLM